MSTFIDGSMVKAAVLGLAVADALGVPVEFRSREELQLSPVTGMRGYGTWDQPAGTWSDDTSLTLALMASLTNGLNYEDIMLKFRLWYEKGEFSAHGEAFDVGITTQQALLRHRAGVAALQCGGTLESNNGNGSLMRILPLVFLIPEDAGVAGVMQDVHYNLIHYISALTHAHPRSQMVCGIYLHVAAVILHNDSLVLYEAVACGLKRSRQYYSDKEPYASELHGFNRLFSDQFALLAESDIRSTGYVVDSLEAALWCLLDTDDYRSCVQKAVNMGGDTDTIAAIAGGVAGLYYGLSSVPAEWLAQLVRRDYIERICEAFADSIKYETIINRTGILER